MTLLRSLMAAVLLLPLLVSSAFAQGYLVRSGDVLRLEVLEDSSLNRELIVLPDGSVSVPFVGAVRARGQTVTQIQQTIASGLAPSFAERPTVFLEVSSLFEAPEFEEPDPITMGVYVIGEVPEPGKREIEPGTTVLQFLAEMGGFTDFAATKRIQLRTSRSGTEQVYSMNYHDVERGVVGGLTTVLVEGDVIVVPQRRLFE